MRRPRSSSIRLRLQSHRAKLSCSTTATSSSAVAGSTETLHHGKTLHHGGHGGQEVEPDGFSPPCPPCPLWWRVQTVATGRVFASVSPVSTVVESSDRGEMFWDVLEEVLGVDRGHAAASSRGDRLPIDVVLHVAARKHARDARLRSVVRDDVAVRVHLELTAEQ